MPKETIVVTGMGVIAPIGENVSAYAEGLKNGRDGCAPVTRFDVSADVYVTRNGMCLQIEDDVLERFDPSKVAYIAVQSAQAALENARLPLEEMNPYRIGVSLGSIYARSHALCKFCKQQAHVLAEQPDHALLRSTPPSVSGLVCKHLGLSGPSIMVSTACSSSTTSVGYAMDLLRSGRVDAMLAGGADLIDEVAFSGFNSLQNLARGGVYRPLSKSRTGLLLGEGAAIFVLERKADALQRRASVYAELLGHAICNEAYHPTAPDKSGAGIIQVMQTALRNAGVTVDDVDYINAHGTGTDTNDPLELEAIKRLFGHRLNQMCVSSTKSMIGHAMGAAGSLELAATILGMKYGFTPPTINFEAPIEQCEQIDVVPNAARMQPINIALSNSFAFAGHLAAIVVKRWKDKD